MTDEPQTDEPQPVEPTPTKAERPMFWRQQHLIGIVAVVVTFIFGATGVYFYFFAEAQARLDIELLTEVVIADLAREPGEQLKLTYGEEQIESASLVSLRVTNSGNLDLVPINHEDLSDRRNARITIEFPEGARILEASAKPTGDDKSTELAQTPTSDPNKATFVVLLMNENAEAQIDLVVADYQGNETMRAASLGIGITGRFGIESEPVLVVGELLRAVVTLWAIGFVFAITSFDYKVTTERNQPTKWQHVIKAMLGSFGFVLVVFVIWGIFLLLK